MARQLELLNTSLHTNRIRVLDDTQFLNRVRVGMGDFGTVERAQWTDGATTVALKTPRNWEELVRVDTTIKAFIKELVVHYTVCSHGRICTFFGVTQNPATNKFALVSQYADGGNLCDYLQEKFSKLKWADKLRLGREITEGLVWLHREAIVHGSLHSKNVLIHQGHVVLADFGLSKLQDKRRGHPAYVEPQCYLQDNYRLDQPSCDIYSLGVLLWQLTSGQPPFDGKSDERIAYRISMHEREDPVDGTAPDYVNLYCECWQDTPNRRPTASEVLQRLNAMNPNAGPPRTAVPLLPPLTNVNVAATSIGGSTRDPPDPPPVSSPTAWQEQYLEDGIELYLICLKTDSARSWENWKAWRNNNYIRGQQLFDFLSNNYAGVHQKLMIAEFYKTGFGVAENGREAFDWTVKAIEAGDFWAHYYNHQCYIHGWGVEKDGRKALDSAKAAADLNLPFGWHNLGTCYLCGMGVNLDLKQAKECYMRAAKAEYVPAQKELATIYSREGSAEEAQYWYKKALEHGEDVQAALRGVEGLLESNQVAKG